MFYNQKIKKKLNLYLIEQDSKIVSMLTWCGIGALGSYLILIFDFVASYSTLKMDYHFFITVTATIFLLVTFSRVVWRNFAYKPVVSRSVIKAFIGFDIDANNKRLKLLSGLVITYTVMVQAGCLYCLYHSLPNINVMIGEILCSLGLMLALKLTHVRKYIVNYIEVVENHLPDRHLHN